MAAADAKDHQIIRMLQENARMSLAELAARVNLAPPSVRERLTKLEKQGVIKGYSAVLDTKKLGLDVTVFMLVTLSDHTQKQHVLDALGRVPEVLECHHIAGEENFLVKVKTASIATLEDLLSRIFGLGGVAKTRSIIVLATYFEDRPPPILNSSASPSSD